MSTGGGGIDVGAIKADLEIDSTNLERGLANARRAVAACEDELRQLRQELKNGSIEMGPFNARTAALAQTIRDLEAGMRAAYSGTTKLDTGLEVLNAGMSRYHTGMGGIRDGNARLGYSFLLLGQMVDDAQYGFRSIVNNIPGVTMALTGSTGLGGALALTGVAINTWVQKWDYAKDAFADTSSFRAAERAIEAIGDAAMTTMASIANLSLTPMTIKDVANLQRAKQEKEAIRKADEKASEKIGDVGGEREQERGQAFREAVQRYGGDRELIEDIYARTARQGEEGAKRDRPVAEGSYLDQATGLWKAMTKGGLEVAYPTQAAAARAIGLPGFGAETAGQRTERERQQVEAYRRTQRARIKQEIDRAIKEGDEEAIRRLTTQTPRLGSLYRESAAEQKKQDELDRRQAAHHDRETAGHVGRLMQGRLGWRALSGGSLTARDVWDELVGSGMEPEKARAAAMETLQGLNRQARDAVEARAMERGITREEAGRQLAAEGKARAVAAENASDPEGQLRARQHDQEVARRAGELYKGQLGRVALQRLQDAAPGVFGAGGEALDTGKVAEALARMPGMTPGRARADAAETLQAINRRAREEVAERAGQRNITAEEARRDLAAERMRAEKAQADQENREALDRVRKERPKVVSQAEAAMIALRVRGYTPERAQEIVRERLERSLANPDLDRRRRRVHPGVPDEEHPAKRFSPEDAKRAAKAATDAGAQAIKERTRKIMEQVATGGGWTDVGRAEQFGAIDLAAKVQAGVGVGVDYGKDQVKLLESIDKTLVRMEGARGREFSFEVK